MNRLNSEEILRDRGTDQRHYKITGFSREELEYMRMGGSQEETKERFLTQYDAHNGEGAHFWMTAGYGLKDLTIERDHVGVTTYYSCD